MAKLLPSNFYTIQGWMRTELDLKGYELTAYALVHQFSMSEAGVYCGGLTYLASWLGCSTKTAWRALKSLSERELIIEHPIEVSGVKLCNYSVNMSKVWTKCPEGMDKMSNKYVSEYINNKRESNSATQKFTIPSAAEVQAYCDQRNNGISGEEFCDFYTSKGWKVGTTPMKDWQAAVRTWERTRAQKAAPKAAPKKESVFEHNAKVMERLAARFSPEARAQAAAILNPTKQ